MVYCGKPSRGCARCRARRIKCDLGRPGCRKCQTGKHICPGYRNEQDVMFRDETDKTVGRYENSFENQGRKVQRTDPQALCAFIETPRSKQIASQNNRQVLNMALSFLYTRFLEGSYFEWIPLVHQSLPDSSIFGPMVNATALAAYAGQQNQLKYLQEARSIYHNSLEQLRSKLIPGGSTSYEVLAAILLMSRFENLATDSNENTITEAWASHIYGAVTILGSTFQNISVADQTSIRLIAQTLQNYSVYCMHKGQRRPAIVTDAAKMCREKLGAEEDAAFQELQLRSQTVVDVFWDFRKTPEATDTVSALQSIQQATQIDESLVSFMAEMAVKIPFQTISIQDDSELPINTRHVYRSHHEARLWNSMRMVRAAVHDRIIDSAAIVQTEWARGVYSIEDPVIYGLLPQMQKMASMVIDQMAEDICISSLQYLRKGDKACTYTAASYLAWPLFVAGRSCRERREFAKSQLRWIGEEFKIKSASLAAVNIDRAKYKDDWLYVSYLS